MSAYSVSARAAEVISGLKTKVGRLEGENAALRLDLARAKDRLKRVTAERDAHQRSHTDAAATASQLRTQLDAVGDQIRARLEACLNASADEPGQSHLAAAVRQVRRIAETYEATARGTP